MVLIPGAPLVLITLFVQVVAVTLLPAALVFLILLLNDKDTMGDRVNTRWDNIVNGAIVAVDHRAFHPLRGEHAVSDAVQLGEDESEFPLRPPYYAGAPGRTGSRHQPALR